MKVKDLNGREQHLKFKAVDTTKGSAPHKKARELLSELFPFQPIYEEVKVPGTRLRLDFILPRENLVVEVDGRQHNEKVSFFHKVNTDYLQSRQRDLVKERWCAINNLKLVRLIDGESDEEWRSRFCR